MKNTRKHNVFLKALALLLAVISATSPMLGVFADDFVEPVGEAYGISSGASYMIKNSASGKYLTLPGYFDIKDNNNNVYQDVAAANDQYSRAVRVIYSSASQKYTLSPLMFENIISGGLANDGSGNVVFAETISPEYNWAIEKVSETGYRIYCGGLALASYGNGVGSVVSNGATVAGNIYLTEIDQNSLHQIWTFESVTVNPHMLKDNSITKKNLGTGAEWIFQLGSGEMGSSGVIISSIEFSNTDIVRYEIIGGKRVIVKLKDDLLTPNDRSDNYTVMRFNLSSNVSRIAVIQDAGTGTGDACLTLPFEEESVMRVVTLEEGANSEYILTFKSSLGNVKIKKWELKDGVGGIEFSKSHNKILTGENFAIVNLYDCGFMLVKATTETDVEYTMLIEVRRVVDNDIYASLNSIDLQGNMDIYLTGDQHYLIRHKDIFTEIKSFSVWFKDSIGDLNVKSWGREYILFETYNYVQTLQLEICTDLKNSTVSNETKYSIMIHEVEFLSNDPGVCYTIKIAEGDDIYMVADKYDDEPRAGRYLTDITPEAYWRIALQDNGAYIICLMDMTPMKEIGKALGFKDGEIVLLPITSGNIEYLLWNIDAQMNGATQIISAEISHYMYDDVYLSLGSSRNGIYSITVDDNPHVWELEEPIFDAYHSGWYTDLQRTEDGEFIMYYYVDEGSIDSSMGGGDYAKWMKNCINNVIQSWDLEKVGISLVRVNSPHDRAHITFRICEDEQLNCLGKTEHYNVAGVKLENVEFMDVDWYRTEINIYRRSSFWEDCRVDIVDYIKDNPNLVYAIVAHELGHALKLAHVVNGIGCSVMRSNTGEELLTYLPSYYDLFTLREKLESLI